MQEQTTHRLTPRLVIGGALCAFGLIELLENFDVLDSRDIPLIGITLVLLGISFWLSGANRLVSGGIAGAGAWSVLYETGIVSFGIFDLWPLALILLGLSIFLSSWEGGTESPPGPGSLASQPARINEVSIFSNRTVKPTSKFSGGSFFSFLSGPTIDLSEAMLEPDASLSLITFAAGTKIIIPDDCAVSSSLFPFMAGYEDRSRSRTTARRKLSIHGFTMWGGVEVIDGESSRGKEVRR